MTIIMFIQLIKQLLIFNKLQFTNLNKHKQIKNIATIFKKDVYYFLEVACIITIKLQQNLL